MGVDGLPVPVPGLDPLADLADQGLLASGLALGPRRLVLRAIYALTGLQLRLSACYIASHGR